jgi:hypothetical protein
MPYLDDNGLVRVWNKIVDKFATIKYVDDSIPSKTSQLTNDSGFITINEVPPQQEVDLSDYALKSEIPTDYAKENHTHSQYLTEHQSLSAYSTTAQNDAKYQPKGSYLTSVPSEYITESELNAKKYLTSVPSEYVTETELSAKGYQTTTSADSKYQPKGNYLTSVPSEYVTESELNAKGYLTQHQDLSGYAKKNEVPSKTSQLINDSGYITINDVPTSGGGSGGVTSWNDLEDKPFGEVPSDTLTWDGNTEGKASVYVSAYNATLYHVSNSAPTVSDLTNGGTYALNVFTPTDFDSTDYIQAVTPVIIFDGGAIFIALEDTTYNSQQVIKGTYLVNDRGAYVKSFKVNGYTGFTSIKTIDEKYLPEGIGTGGDVDLSSYQTKTDSTLATSDKTVVGAINEVNSNKVDKVSGKGLSTNDLTANLKSNYDSAYSHTLNKSNPHGVTLSQLGVNATATELNYVDGVTSSIQTQLDNKAPSTHTHPYVSSMSVSGSTLKYTKGDGTTGSVTLPSGGSGGTGGGVTSWNDLEDKPFGEVNVSTGELTYDLSVEIAETLIPNLELEEGVEYIVNWNGVEYKRTAVDILEFIPSDMSSWYSKYIAIGNIGDLSGINTGEPFVIYTGTFTNNVPIPEFAGQTMTAFEPLEEGVTQITLSITAKQIKYLDNKYIKDMYGGDGASNKLDFLTATPYAYFNIDGVGIPMFQLDGVSADGREIIGITGFNTITYEGETITTPIGPVSADNIQPAQDMITEFGIEGVLAYVSINDSELGMLMFFCVMQEQPASAIFSTTIKTGWYMLDYAGTIEQFLFGVIPSVNYITAPTPIFSNIKYVPNKYLEILEVSSSGGSDTLTWDGNTDGKTYIENSQGTLIICHISDAVPTAEDMANGVVICGDGFNTSPFEISGEKIASLVTENHDGYFNFEAIAIVPTDGYTLGTGDTATTFPKKGVYFIKATDGSLYTTSFQINGYTFPSEGKYTIKHEYLPTLEYNNIILKSSTSGSSKKFKVTVDDSGTLTATEIV